MIDRHVEHRRAPGDEPDLLALSVFTSGTPTSPLSKRHISPASFAPNRSTNPNEVGPGVASTVRAASRSGPSDAGSRTSAGSPDTGEPVLTWVPLVEDLSSARRVLGKVEGEEERMGGGEERHRSVVLFGPCSTHGDERSGRDCNNGSAVVP